MKIVIAAGGTGGHIYPGIAIAQNFNGQVLFIGSCEGLEKEIVPKYGFAIKLIKARGMLRKLSYKAVSAPFVSFIGFIQSLLILNDFKPAALVSTGGYASLPVVFAAKCLRIPIILQEQNLLPGMANKFCARFSDKVFLSFEESKQYLKGEVVGNPVRLEIINPAAEDLALPKDKKIVLVMGGSQGAKAINKLILQILNLLDKSIYLVQVIGKRDFPWVVKALKGLKTDNYRPLAYAHNMPAYLNAASLVISRAGATAIAEYLAVGLPMVLIPFPYAAENHQLLNARSVEEKGAAIVIEEENLKPEEFAGIINKISVNYDKMKKVSSSLAQKDAAKKIVDFIYAGYRQKKS